MKSTNVAPNGVLPFERHYTTSETGTTTRLHPESIRRAIRQGRIRAKRVGRKLLIPESEIERILAEGLPSLTD